MVVTTRSDSKSAPLSRSSGSSQQRRDVDSGDDTRSLQANCDDVAADALGRSAGKQEAENGAFKLNDDDECVIARLRRKCNDKIIDYSELDASKARLHHEAFVAKNTNTKCKSPKLQQIAKSNANSTSNANTNATDNNNNKQQQQQNNNNTNLGKRYRRFKLRVWMAFCCLGYKKNKSSIEDVGKFFARIYQGPNMGLAHLAATMMLIKRFQDKQQQWMLRQPALGIKQFLNSVPVTDQTRFLDVLQAPDSHLVNEMIYYMNYSLSIFGWPLYTIDGVHQVCCLFPYMKLNCCTCRKNKTKETLQQNQNLPEEFQFDYDDLPVVLGDNCVGCNLAAADRRLSGHHYDIIYINYESAINVVPFIVVADHSKQTVVVGIRGSMAISDAIIDLNVMIEPLPLEPEQPEMYGHRGMILSASYIKQTLIKHRVLESAFASRPDLGSENYGLLFCGHSLGGGVAAIMSLLYHKQYPNLRAYLYSPPGGILSLPAVELSKKYCTGVFLGNDCVPRAGLAQMERLIYQSYWAKKRVQQSNVGILARALGSKFCCCPTGFDSSASSKKNRVYDYDPAHSLDFCFGQAPDCPPFEFKGQLIEFPAKEEALFVPGKLIHVVKDYSIVKNQRRCLARNPHDQEPMFRAIWVENTDYDRIVVDEGMVMDHMPFALMHSMKMLFARTIPPNNPNNQAKPFTKQPRSSNHWFHDNSVSPQVQVNIPPNHHSTSAVVVENRDQLIKQQHYIKANEQQSSEDKLMIKDEEEQKRKLNTQDMDYNNNNNDDNNNNNNDITIDNYYNNYNNNNNDTSQDNYYRHMATSQIAGGGDANNNTDNNNNSSTDFAIINRQTTNQRQSTIGQDNSTMETRQQEEQKAKSSHDDNQQDR